MMLTLLIVKGKHKKIVMVLSTVCEQYEVEIELSLLGKCNDELEDMLSDYEEGDVLIKTVNRGTSRPRQIHQKGQEDSTRWR